MEAKITLDTDLEQRIQQMAQARKLSMSDVLQDAVKDYVQREEHKEAFKQEALQSWQEYRQTGRHLTAEEAGDWLTTWGTEQESDVPKCHD